MSTDEYSSICESETSLILALPVWRKIRYQWSETLAAGFWLAVSILVLIMLFKPVATAFWYVLAGVIFSLSAFYRLLFWFAGTEIIEINQETIKVWSGIGLFKRSTLYQANTIRDLRCTSTTYLRRTKIPGALVKSIGPSQYWETVVDPRTSSIACNDDDGQTIYLIGWIHKSLARHFVSLTKERFPHYN